MTPIDPDRTAESPDADTTDPVLGIPDGWVIDQLCRDRLRRQLERADPSYAGVVAQRIDLPAGSSYRVASERRALEPAAARSTEMLEWEGSVMVRAGVGYELADGEIRVEHGPVLVDPGAMVHDPWRPVGPLASASPLGRPVFPSRPVALFLGFEPDPDLADWVRATVNDLVRDGTEGRIAVPEPTDGLHLTRPCAPIEESVIALAPDVVVALDEQAAELGSRWLGRDRSAVVIALTRDTAAEVEIVSWRIGHSQGRIRARIGRGITAATLADLVRRLCAGPQALPPLDRDRAEQPARRRRPTSPAHGALDAATHIVALTGDTADRPRCNAFADHTAAFGARMTIAAGDEQIPEAAGSAGLVIVRSLSESAPVRELVDARRRQGLPTVVDIGPRDVHIEPNGRQPRLHRAAAELAAQTGLATTTSVRIHELLGAQRIRSHVLPSLLTRARTADLTAQRERRRGRGPLVLGWHTGPDDAPTTDDAIAVLELVRTLLAFRPELEVEIVGDATHVAAPLDAVDRVTFAPGSAETRAVARWTAQLWTTSALDAEISGDLRTVVEAHLLGVPTYVAAENPAVREGLVVRALAVDEAEGWGSVAELLDDEVVWSARSREAAGLAEALYGPDSSLAIMNRFLGWLRFDGAS